MKQILLIILSIFLISCEDTSQLRNGVETSTIIWDNNKPVFLDGLYGTDRIDSEQGTVIFMSDRVVINTTNHKHEFKYADYMNAIGTYDEGKPCNWYIRVNDIEYRFTTSSYGEYTLFSFKRDSDKEFSRVGVYYKDFKEPIINN